VPRTPHLGDKGDAFIDIVGSHTKVGQGPSL